ncbi:RNase H domain-containing protein [Trichonephila clavipes]|nr:RNase H domain-containing protein [Trichonephila clavipes]
MITNFFIPELNNRDVQELWFQQDGATCHTARPTIDLLKDTFGDRLISRFGPVNWHRRSCDLTPLDYFSFGSAPYSSTVGPFSCPHVDLIGNEVADDLAKAATSNPMDPEDHMDLTSTEIYSRANELICRIWVVPPVHPWYFQRHPGSAISFKGSRSYQTAFSRFSTGYLRCMNFEDGKEASPICPKCNIPPQHILQCLGFSCEEAGASPLLFLDFVQIYGLMDLV